ncbi:hypothetical protein NX059_012312 [Plenodomus lindquistii]|nr:hypothetical protein NX059_012312 [Plenodomus lindquistii]
MAAHRPLYETPPQQVPLASSNPTTALHTRDSSCRLGRRCEQLQVAHVVPQAGRDWWSANDMLPHNTGSTDTLCDTAPAPLWRADLHVAFYKPRVAFVSKPAAGMRPVPQLLH